MKKSVIKIIKNEFINLINEYYDVNDIQEKYFDLEFSILNDFLYNNNSNFTKKISWNVVKFSRLKKIWEVYMKTGVVRDTRGLDDIIETMITNTIKISIITYLSGHEASNPRDKFEEYFSDWIDEQVDCLLSKSCDNEIHPFSKKIFNEKWDDDMTNDEFRNILMDELLNNFYYYYVNDSNMGDFISDYALKPLVKLMYDLVKKETPEEKLLVVDRMLNVIHQRSDVANWYVEGEVNSLNKLSGYFDNDGDSVITCKYRRSDYM